MRNVLVEQYDEEIRAFAENLLEYVTIAENEAVAQNVVEQQFRELGFNTYRWEANDCLLAMDDAFPAAADLNVTGRPNIGGVVEFGNPDKGPTLVLNGHIDVVPVEEGSWETDPFDPVWDGDILTARGAVDMKVGLATLTYAVKALADEYGDNLQGRIVIESVVGEEEGGIGAKSAAVNNPYPFERDAALIAEPTELNLVTAVEGSLIFKITIEGRSAHAANRWCGESVLPHFEAIRTALLDMEAERNEIVTHPLYTDYPISWPVNVGIVDAGIWASSVPAHLEAQVRIGVAPGENLREVETVYYDRLRDVIEERSWLSEHVPTIERQSIQFTSAEIDSESDVVQTLQGAMADHNLDTEPIGVTYGADSRHYIEAGIPTVLFGPGNIDNAHFPNESIDWSEVHTAFEVIVDTARQFLSI